MRSLLSICRKINEKDVWDFRFSERIWDRRQNLFRQNSKRHDGCRTLCAFRAFRFRKVSNFRRPKTRLCKNSAGAITRSRRRNTYRFKVIPRYGKPKKLETLPGLENGVEVEITTEDPNNEETSVFFNRAAAASSAFNKKFPDVKDVSENSTEAAAARKWLSNGLEEAVLAFLAKAEKGDALHAAVYEFQKQELLKRHQGRGAARR